MKTFKTPVPAVVAKTIDLRMATAAQEFTHSRNDASLHLGAAALSISQFDALPDSAYLRAAQLVQSPKHPNNLAPLPFSAPTLWRKVKDGSFPAPVKLSAGVTAWRLGAIRSWLAAKSEQGGAEE